VAVLSREAFSYKSTMRAFIQKHCRSLLRWPREFFDGQSRGLAVLVALALPALAKIRAKSMSRTPAARNSFGTVAVEFALVGPVLLLAMVGIFVFGIALNNWVILTNAAEAGALQFAASRGDSDGTPWTDTTNAIYNAAGNLMPFVKTSLTITLSVNGTACTSDATCLTALSTNAGNPAIVTASYPCISSNPNLTVYGHQYSPSCTLKVSTTERIQ
jgi:Flp pilus assembly protein TadG